MAVSFGVQIIEQEALKQILKRVKNPVDKNTDNDHRQYNGKDHLFGIEPFHVKIRVTLLCPIQTQYEERELRVQYTFLR